MPNKLFYPPRIVRIYNITFNHSSGLHPADADQKHLEPNRTRRSPDRSSPRLHPSSWPASPAGERRSSFTSVAGQATTAGGKHASRLGAGGRPKLLAPISGGDPPRSELQIRTICGPGARKTRGRRTSGQEEEGYGRLTAAARAINQRNADHKPRCRLMGRMSRLISRVVNDGQLLPE